MAFEPDIGRPGKGVVAACRFRLGGSDRLSALHQVLRPALCLAQLGAGPDPGRLAARPCGSLGGRDADRACGRDGGEALNPRARTARRHSRAGHLDRRRSGESLRIAVDPFAASPDPASIASRIGQWTLIYAAVVGIQACWRMRADFAAVAATAASADARARRALLAVELEALQRQIEPHFLFNTLATIRRLGTNLAGRRAPAIGAAPRLHIACLRRLRGGPTPRSERRSIWRWPIWTSARREWRRDCPWSLKSTLQARAGRIPSLMLEPWSRTPSSMALGPSKDRERSHFARASKIGISRWRSRTTVSDWCRKAERARASPI